MEYMNNFKNFKEQYGMESLYTVESNKITEIENQLPNNYKFPKAYKEFLELSGKEFPAMKMAVRINQLNLAQKLTEDQLGLYDLKGLIQKDFWVFGTMEASITYFHFDEGDNPPVYQLNMEDYAEFKEIIDFRKTRDTFQEWVEFYIDMYNPDFD